jgi:hypothetical protein
MPTDELPIACRLTDPDLARRVEELEREVWSHAEEVREEPDGYALRFPGTDEWLVKLAQLIAFERQCCPFLAFDLHAAPNDGPLTLRLGGSPAAKAFLSQALAVAAGKT